jgi:hypothetical protein
VAIWEGRVDHPFPDSSSDIIGVRMTSPRLAELVFASDLPVASIPTCRVKGL